MQGNPINVFNRNQPHSCFTCSSVGHEARSCPTKAKKTTAAPPASDTGHVILPLSLQLSRGTKSLQIAVVQQQRPTTNVVSDIPPHTEGVPPQPLTIAAVEPVANPPAEKHLMDTESGIPATHQLPPNVTSTQPSKDNSATTQASAVKMASDLPPQDDATQQDLNSLVLLTTQQLLDNFNTTPPTILHPHPPMDQSDSSQSAIDERPTVERSATKEKGVTVQYPRQYPWRGRIKTTPKPSQLQEKHLV